MKRDAMVSGKRKKRESGSKEPGGEQQRTMQRIDFCDRAIEVIFYLSLIGGATVFLPRWFNDGFEVPKLFLVQLGAAAILFLLLIRSVLKGVVEITLPLSMVPLVALFLLSAVSIAWGINPLLGLEELFRVSALAGFCFFSFYLCRNGKTVSPLYFILFACLAIAVWALMLDYSEPLRDWIYPYYKSTGINVPGKIASFYRS
ncbi:MAG: hypothetical protein U9P14_11025, partial [Gemmatimonadota bacterium]|nr:hypothetical protein [Gemmatimonadota bacterium]